VIKYIYPGQSPCHRWMVQGKVVFTYTAIVISIYMFGSTYRELKSVDPLGRLGHNCIVLQRNLGNSHLERHLGYMSAAYYHHLYHFTEFKPWKGGSFTVDRCTRSVKPPYHSAKPSTKFYHFGAASHYQRSRTSSTQN